VLCWSLLASHPLDADARRPISGRGLEVKLTTFFLVFGVLFTGCNTIDHRNPPPDDFPKDLRIVVHRPGVLGFVGVRECDGAIGGCTIADFCSEVCRIYLQLDLKWIEDHERSHCAGWDHSRESHMRDQWENYKLMDGPAFCMLRRGDAQ
jgi:hypothetical protein